MFAPAHVPEGEIRSRCVAPVTLASMVEWVRKIGKQVVKMHRSNLNMVSHRNVHPSAEGKSESVSGRRFMKTTIHRNVALLIGVAVEVGVCCTDQKVAKRLHKMGMKLYLWAKEVSE